MKLSVIIPGYNTPDKLWARCLRSVLSALPPESEVICVDDGSVRRPEVNIDGAEGVVKWIYLEKNGGQAAARNRSLDIAQGEYVTFVDSDDEVLPGIYEATLKKMADTKSDVGFFGVKSIWVDDGLQRADVPADCYYGNLTPDDINEILKSWLFLYPVNKIFRRSCVSEFDPEGMPCEDAMFNLEMAMKDTKWCSIDKIGYIYYRTYSSSLATYKACHSVGQLHMAEMWKEYCESNERAKELFAQKASIARLSALEWGNIWKLKSPYSLRGKWQWLKNHPELGGMLFFTMSLARHLIRRYFYLRPIRRANVRRLCKGNVEDWNG